MMNFYKWLESQEWTRSWGTIAAGCIAIAKFDETGKNPSGKILAAFRSSSVMAPNQCWSGMGGAIKGIHGEREMTPEAGAINEFREESGYHGPIASIVPGYVFPGDNRGKIPYHNFIVIVEKEFQPHANWENDDIRWFTWEELMAANPKHPGFTMFLRHDENLIKSIISKFTVDKNVGNDKLHQ